MERILVYKRTHTGDPDDKGVFGCCDCMGTVRNREFDAVIGIGGQGNEARKHDIDRKITWIGIGPTKKNAPESWEYVGPLVTFDHFVKFDAEGELLEELAPHLARRLFVKKPRTVMSFTNAEWEEVQRILKMAKNAPPSRNRGEKKLHVRHKCCVSRGGC